MIFPSICAAVVSPVTKTAELDTGKLVAHVKRLLNNGCEGVVLFGTTGEGPSFSMEQRRNTLETILVSGIPATKIIVGTGCCSVADTAGLSKHALDLGCAAVLVHPPFFFRPTEDEGVFSFFESVVTNIGDSARDILFYHFPEMTGAPISFTVIERLLVAFPNVFVGIKDSTGSLENMVALAQRFPELKVYSGDDNLLWPLLEAGGYGAITATANLTPSLLTAVKAGWKANTQDAQDAQAVLVDLWEKTLLKFPVSEAVKETIAAHSSDESWVNLCPPLVRLPEPRRQQLLEITRQYTKYFPKGLGAL